jgi:hypothetical protein
MKSQRLLAYLGLFAAGCGMRVIGDLGDDASGIAAGASGSSTTNTGGASALPTSLGGSSAVTAGMATGGNSNGNVTTGGTAATNGGSSPQAGTTTVATGAGGTASNGGAAGEGGARPTNSAEAGASSLDAGAGGQGGEAPTLPPLTAVPVLRLELDDCTGPVVDEQSQDTGARYDVDCSDGVLGKAAHFSATPSDQGPRLLEFADAPRFAFSHELTVAAWVKPEAGGAYLQAIVDKWYALDMFELALRYVKDGDGNWSPRFAFSVAEPEGDWGRPADAISPVEVDFGQWSHVAGVYRWNADGPVGHITLYVNGQVMAQTSTKVGTTGLQQSTRPLRVGYADLNAQFIGSIDDVRLYDVALGPELGWLYLDPAHP